MPEPYTVHLFPVITLNMYNIYITLCAILVILLIYYIILHYTQFFCYREQNLITLINVRGYFIVDKKEKKKNEKGRYRYYCNSRTQSLDFFVQELGDSFQSAMLKTTRQYCIPKNFNDRIAALIFSLWHIVDCSGFFVATGN